MNLEFVRQLRFVPIVQRYDARDSTLYALSLGMGRIRSMRTNCPSSTRAMDCAWFQASA